MTVPGRLLAGAALVLLAAFPAGAQDLFQENLTSFRQAPGLSVPGWDDTLARSCGRRAEVLAAGGLLSHQDRSGRGPGLQLTAEGYPPGEFGEILGAGADPAEVWEAWLASAPHRAVLETPGWIKWGWGSAPSGKTNVWVLRFWKP